MNEDKILNEIGTKLKDAVNWSNSNIANKQEKALKYYKRELLPGDDKIKGRSKWVSDQVQTRIDWMNASLIRIFDSPESVCEFLPFGPEDAPIAKQQTDVVNWVLKTKNSHLAFLHPWIQNGLLTGLGIVTAEFESVTEEGLPKFVKGVPAPMLEQYLAQEEAGQIVIEEASKVDRDNRSGQTPQIEALALQNGVSIPDELLDVYDLKIREVKTTQVFNIFTVDPEDFIVSRDAKFDHETGGISARLQGHRKLVTKGDLIALGFDADKIDSLPQATEKLDGIATERFREIDGKQGVNADDVDVFTVFTKMKIDDKKARHYKLTLAGSLESPVLLDHEECSRFYPFAAFVPFPIAGTLFGMGIADKIGDDHILLSKMQRAVIDDLHNHVNPVKVVNPAVTNLDDLMNMHPGKVIRSDDPSGGISYNISPFNGANAIPVIQNIAAGLDFNIGVGPQMVSVNASDMQDVTATASNNRANASQLLIELVSRFFADTGYRYLIKMVVDLLIQKPDEAQALIARLTNQPPVLIDAFNPEMDVTTSVAFGVMSRDQSTAQLSNILNQQMQLAGSGSPIVSPQNIYSTLAKMAETAGFKNSAMFFTDPSTLPPPAPPAPPQPSPDTLAAIQLEQTKAQLKFQSDEADRQFRMTELAAKQDFDRDKLAQEFALKKAEIEAKYAAQVEVEKLRIEQDMKRDLMGNIVTPVYDSGIQAPAIQPSAFQPPAIQPQPELQQQPVSGPTGQLPAELFNNPEAAING